MEFTMASDIALAILALSVTLVLYGVTRLVSAYRNLPGRKRFVVRSNTPTQNEARRMQEARGHSLYGEAVGSRRALEAHVLAGNTANIRSCLDDHYLKHAALVIFAHKCAECEHVEDDEYLFALGQMKNGGALPPNPYEDEDNQYAPAKEFKLKVK